MPRGIPISLEHHPLAGVSSNGWSESLPARSFTGENSAPWQGAQNNRAENSHQVVRPTRTQAAVLQITGLRPALPQHACRCPQHIQPTAASCLSLNSPDLPIRCGCAMARRNRRRMKPSPVHPSSAETAQLDNAPARNTWYHVLPRRDDDARFRGTPTKRNDPLNLANASPSEAQARTTVQPTPRTYASQSR